MASLRQRVSDRLLAAGANTALDCREMRRAMDASGRRWTVGDTRALATLDMVSTIWIRIGMLLMPSRVPEQASHGGDRGDR